MRTSNKILLGLLILVFTVPFMLALTLSKKIKKGEYTVVQNENIENGELVKGNFASGKVVKVIAPGPEFLEVKLTATPETKYSYYRRNDADSFAITNINDTIVMQYIGKTKDAKNDERGWGDRMIIRVNLPVVNTVVVDGAIVILDSFPSTDNNMSVIIRNRGELKDGGRNQTSSLPAEPAAGSQPAELHASVNTEMSGAAFVGRLVSFKAITPEQAELNIKDQLLEVLTKGI